MSQSQPKLNVLTNGAEPLLITSDLLHNWPLPRLEEGDDKDDRGRVVVVGGALEMPGALILAGTAVLRAGAGKVQMATCRSIAQAIAIAVPEALVAALPETALGGIDAAASAEIAARANQADVLLIGPGMMDEDAVHQLVPDLLRRLKQRLVVLDALAMEVATRDAPAIQDLGGQVILTPHAGEMASMLHIPKEQVLRDPSAITLVAAEQFRAIVALKGSQTYIGTPEGILYCFRSGTIGLATAGSGDTLAGIIAGIAARGATPAQAAVWGVYLHGTAGNTLAARIGPLGFLAREVLAEVPHTMATVDRQNTPL